MSVDCRLRDLAPSVAPTPGELDQLKAAVQALASELSRTPADIAAIDAVLRKHGIVRGSESKRED